MKVKTEAEDLEMKATFSSQDSEEIYYLLPARPVTALLNIIENLVNDLLKGF